MMNDIPNDFYTLRQRIDQSTHNGEIIQIIQEIAQFISSDNADSEAYDLLADAFQASQRFTRKNPTSGEHIIIEYLLPYLEQDRDVPEKASYAITRLRECLVQLGRNSIRVLVGH